jgi:hypothetical protein
VQADAGPVGISARIRAPLGHIELR